MMQFLAARVAMICDLQEGAEHMPLAAGRALAAQPVPQVGFQRGFSRTIHSLHPSTWSSR
jgi:hypothetical protein